MRFQVFHFCQVLCLFVTGLGFSLALPLHTANSEQKEKEGETKFNAGFDAPLAKEMWDKSIAKPEERFILLRSWDEKKEEEEEPEFSVVTQKPETPAEESEPKNKEPEMVGETRESIIERYGEPRGEVVIVPEKNSPKPFKAIHAALQIGDEELAFDYARKHVRYLSEFQGRMGDLTGLIAKAMEVEGIEDGEGWTSAPIFDKYNKHLEKAEKEKLKEQTPNWDQFVLALPEKHRLRAITPLSEALPDEFQFEQEHRDDFRRVFHRVAPRSLDGIVNLILYVKLDIDKSSVQVARELKKIAEFARRNPKITFEVMADNMLDEGQMRNFIMKTGLHGAKFTPLKYDDPQPTMLPMLSISIPSLNQTFEIEGVRRSYFYEELISVMHGGALS